MRRELKADVEVVGAPYGKFEVLVDGTPVLVAGSLAALGILPSARVVLDAVRVALGQPSTV